MNDELGGRYTIDLLLSIARFLAKTSFLSVYFSILSNGARLCFDRIDRLRDGKLSKRASVAPCSLSVNKILSCDFSKSTKREYSLEVPRLSSSAVLFFFSLILVVEPPCLITSINLSAFAVSTNSEILSVLRIAYFLVRVNSNSEFEPLLT